MASNGTPESDTLAIARSLASAAALTAGKSCFPAEHITKTISLHEGSKATARGGYIARAFSMHPGYLVCRSHVSVIVRQALCLGSLVAQTLANGAVKNLLAVAQQFSRFLSVAHTSPVHLKSPDSRTVAASIAGLAVICPRLAKPVAIADGCAGVIQSPTWAGRHGPCLSFDGGVQRAIAEGLLR